MERFCKGCVSYLHLGTEEMDLGDEGGGDKSIVQFPSHDL